MTKDRSFDLEAEVRFGETQLLGTIGCPMYPGCPLAPGCRTYPLLRAEERDFALKAEYRTFALEAE